MPAQCVMFLIICSGSVFAMAAFDSRFERVLPLTCLSAIMLVYLFGICGWLKGGVYAVLAAAAVLYVLAAVCVIRRRRLKKFLRGFVSPQFIAFALIYAALIYLNYGKLPVHDDELSHWADIVKAMTWLNDFGTNPASNSLFKSYLPGMAVFQYLFEKVHFMLEPGADFSDWRLYLAYQTLYAACILPFFGSLRFKRPLSAVLSLFAVFFAPLVVFPTFFAVLQIDGLVAVLAGCGFASVASEGDKDGLYNARILLTVAALVLMKDVGLLFAIMLAAVFVIDTLLRNKQPDGRKCAFAALGAAAAAAVPKLLWNYNISANNVERMFGGKVDVPALAAVLTGKDASWRSDVLQNYVHKLFSEGESVGSIASGVYLPYFLMPLILLALLVLVCWAYGRTGSHDRGTRIAMLCTLTVTALVYVLGLCVMYMFKFSEYEGVRLASFERYFRILLLTLWETALLMTVVLAGRAESRRGLALCCAAFAVTAALLPYLQLSLYLSRENVAYSRRTMQPYYQMSENIKAHLADTDEKVFLVCEGSSGWERLVMRYELRPYTLSDKSGSIGKPFYDGDIWTRDVSPEQWFDELTGENCAYVQLFTINDYFVETYGDLFEDHEVEEYTLYRVDADRHALVKCA